jgi:flagellar protein FliJ
MSKFKFRLATLLRLRGVARDERRAALADAYRVDDLLRGRLEATDAEIGRLKESCRDAARPGTVDVDRLVQAQRYELVLRDQDAQLRRQRETVCVEIERRRQALLEADREVRTLEKLRDKQAEAHRYEESRQDIKRLDEVAHLLSMREAVP